MRCDNYCEGEGYIVTSIRRGPALQRDDDASVSSRFKITRYEHNVVPPTTPCSNLLLTKKISKHYFILTDFYAMDQFLSVCDAQLSPTRHKGCEN